jgi:hypothetical protein
MIGAEFIAAAPEERKPEPPAQGVVGVDPDLNARSAGMKAREMKAQGKYVFSGRRVPLVGRCRRFAETSCPILRPVRPESLWNENPAGRRISARGPRALPGVPAGTLNTYAQGNAAGWPDLKFAPPEGAGPSRACGASALQVSAGDTAGLPEPPHVELAKEVGQRGSKHTSLPDGLAPHWPCCS